MNVLTIWKEYFAKLDADAKSKAKLGCFVLVTTPFLLILKAFAFKMLWGWFCVPFLGVPALTIPLAFGLGIVLEAANGFRYYNQSQSELEKFTLAERRQGIVTAWILPLMGLFIGWILKMFI